MKTVMILQTEQHIFNQAFEDIKKSCRIRSFKTKQRKWAKRKWSKKSMNLIKKWNTKKKLY